MSDALQGELSPITDDASRSRFCGWKEAGSGKYHDTLRPTGAHTSNGLGHIGKAVVQAPIELSVGSPQGLHNVPKVWGDDTVRPQEQVGDFEFGVKAAGKEFGMAGTMALLACSLSPGKARRKRVPAAISRESAKGVHKELQKPFGSNVQNYIVTSRAAQGYEEWVQSSDAEKQDVIVPCKLIPKYLKQKSQPNEMVRDVPEAQRKRNTEDREIRQNCGGTASSAQSYNSADAPIPDPGSAMLAMDGLPSPLRPANTAHEESLGAAEINETIRLSVEETSRGDAEEDAGVERALQEAVSQLQRQGQECADRQADQEELRQAMASSKAEA
ncbi:hypothetical protein B0A55_03003 [Friedmanniomyces simplex]|uniref:Uncharacterized protein n=1 Tax=Friedmanniomyces simplex TaxID=329884 RepID=A0A4U0XY12_9PEZI|nr:hypothetical protein B0A55_03003 [Friedmanniomyces simplex]